MTVAERPRRGAATWRGFLLCQKVLAAVLLAGIVGITLINVSMRYVLSQPIVWADEVARLAFVVFSFLGAALAVATNAHLAIDTLVMRFPERSHRWLRLGVHVVATAFFALLFFGGLHQARINFGQVSPALRIPLGWVYLAVPVGAVLMFLNTLGAHLFEPAELPGSAARQELRSGQEVV